MMRAGSPEPGQSEWRPLRRVVGLLALALLLTTPAMWLGTRFLDIPSPGPSRLAMWIGLGAAADWAELVAIGLLAALAVGGARAGLGSRGWAPAAGLCAALLLVAAGVAGRAGGGVAAVVLFAGSVVAAVALLAVRAAAGARWIVPIVVLAFGLRLGAALALHAYGLSIGPRALVLDDESAYDIMARALVERASQPDAVIMSETLHLVGPHMSLIWALYGAIGADPLVVRIAGAALGTLVVVLGAAVASALFDRRAGLAAGLVLAVFPGLVVWSATLLKEAMVGALVLLVIWAAIRWRRRPSWTLAVLILAALHALSVVRLYAGLGLLVVLGLAFVVSHLRHLAIRRSLRLRGTITVGTAGAAAILMFGASFATYADPVLLVYLQTNMRLVPPPKELLPELPADARTVSDVGGSIVAVRLPGSSTDQPAMVLAWLTDSSGRAREYYVATDRQELSVLAPADVRPINDMDRGVATVHLARGVLYGFSQAILSPLIGPSPRQHYQLLAAEAVVWLAILVAGLLGLRQSRSPLALVPLGFSAVELLTLAVLDGNPGNLARQRASLVVPGFVLAASPLLGQIRPIARAAGWLAGRALPIPAGRSAESLADDRAQAHARTH